jgi:hypothetical protein
MKCNIIHSLKRNEILTHATTWISLENTMLSKIVWTEKGVG